MIDLNNFAALLLVLGFTKIDHRYSKKLTHFDGFMVADFEQKKLLYPEGLTINEQQTCNFSANENFVVFECVYRLLEKGYRPEHIELEPKWKLGHGASGGRADILVSDNAAKALLLIECKTAGYEFDKAWRNTLLDGGQLFSYAQQESETQFLCLYASDFNAGVVTYQSHIIAHRDNEKYLADNPGLKNFKEATDYKSRFAVWRDTYKLDYTTTGIFEDIIQPYHIGKDKYTLDDLHAISAADQQKKYHEFATILRQHNVSGRENAFDKLVNLFLCKLVDETENPTELKFYWKGVAYDTHFELIDRLQQLYKDGMGRFLGEDITYINKDQVINAMRFIKLDMDATQRAVWKLFERQKFFTNNDFSFIDVHNEKLFFKNAEVLLKVLQMWQGVRLINNNGQTNHNQFLGDMFETFLDQGVKQTEGQFFTPLPICRFILMSLPLEHIIRASEHPPKAIDYACGAGHFLNELAQQIAPFVEQYKQAPLPEYHKAIFGIEKEYRLSKIAKVSAFMYGQAGINVCYGDALEPEHPAFPQIQDNTFDLLVANPPYSVRGFLETLPEDARELYSLAQTIDKRDTNNSIETFFIERAKQLLKAGGVAGIILPSSILSNGGATYTRAREILLQYFDIVAIVELGSGTFGKTGTNTVTLFLRCKATHPDTAEHYLGRVGEWFDADENQGVYLDAHLYRRYAEYIGVEAGDYRELLRGVLNDGLMQHETFQAYQKAFESSTDIVNLKKQKGFNAKPAAEQAAELGRRFLGFVQALERDKLYHFILADTQPNPVLIIRSPSDTKAQKQFLGYEWSAAKGSEGIKLMKDAAGRHQTWMFDETRRDNPDKLNALIAANFAGTLGEPPAALAEYVSSARLVDMLDFSRVGFEKQIVLTPKKSIPAIQSKWPLHKLSELVEIISGGTPDTGNSSYWDGDIPWLSVADFANATRFVETAAKFISRAGLQNSSTKLLQRGDIIISARGTVGAMAQLAGPMAFNQSCYGLRAKNITSNDYVFYVLKREIEQLKSRAWGSKFDAITIKTFDEVKIPLPPANIQQAIVTDCEAVDAEVNTAQASIKKARETIAAKVAATYAKGYPMREIDKLSLAVQYGLSEKMNETGTGYKIFRMNEIINGRMHDGGSMKYIDISAEEFAKYKLNPGDVLFNRTNSIEHVGKTGIFDLHGDYCFASYLIRIVPNRDLIHPYFLTLMMCSKDFQTEAKNKASKSINQANINATIMRNIKIPVPPTLDEQNQFVAQIETLEKTIAAAQAVIDAAPAKKRAILDRYL